MSGLLGSHTLQVGAWRCLWVRQAGRAWVGMVVFALRCRVGKGCRQAGSRLPVVQGANTHGRPLRPGVMAVVSAGRRCFMLLPSN